MSAAAAAAAAAAGHDEIPVGGLRRECRFGRRLALPPRMHHGFWPQLQYILLHVRNGNYRICVSKSVRLTQQAEFQSVYGAT